MSADDVIKAHVKALKEGGFVVKLDTHDCETRLWRTGRAAGTQVSCQMSDIRGHLCPGRLFVPYFEALTHILTEKLHFFHCAAFIKTLTVLNDLL